MKRFLSLAILASVLITFSACVAKKEIKVYASDNGGEIVCKPGDVILLSLKANPTTGYDWEVVEPPDDSVIQVGEREFSQSVKDEKLTGAGGVDQWRIQAIQPGRAHLELVHRRHWEKDVEPHDRFSLDIVVQ